MRSCAPVVHNSERHLRRIPALVFAPAHACVWGSRLGICVRAHVDVSEAADVLVVEEMLCVTLIRRPVMTREQKNHEPQSKTDV